MATVAFVGGGPSALVAAIAFARRGIATSVFEREAHPEEAPRFNPDRSYTIDISGHGLRALRHVDACESFDARMFPFKGLKFPDGRVEPWNLPGWTGSRGEILRALMAIVENGYRNRIAAQFQSRVTSVDVNTGRLTFQRIDGVARTAQFDFIAGAGGAGSLVRQAMAEQLAGFTVQTTGQ
jgi:kynurenine 3-monooxygenase